MSTNRHGLCTPDCGYRRLYEGSQASLSDMAANQAGALNRVARLRAGVVGALKQSFPVQFAAAEAAMAKRMSNTEDEVLLAHLTGFLAMPTPEVAPVAPAGLANLRDELTAAGVALPPGADLTAWARAVSAWAAAVAPSPANPESPATAGGEVDSAAPRARRRTGMRNLPAEAGDAAFAPPVDDFDLEDIPVGPEPEYVDDLGAMAPHSSEEVPPPAPDPDDVTPTVLATQDLDDLFGPDLTDLFAGEEPEDAEELVAALFAEDEPPAPAADPVVETFPQPPTTTGLTGPDPATPAVPAPAAEDLPAAPPATHPVTERGPALRPELFPSTSMPKSGKTARRTPRTARVSAAPPDPRGLDVPIASGSSSQELTQELFDKLVAAVVIPRPVFISDLVAQVGSAELVSAWEQRCRDMGTGSPVRFITPKPRHRDRGALVVPHSPELRSAAREFTSSWWATCLDDRVLRGAKLYEVAVLLHRFGEAIISSRIDGDVVVLRVNQPRGLVGVAVTLETDFAAGSPARAQIADAVGELLADRLTLVAVLTYSSGGQVLEKLAEAVREESTARGWQPTAPVIASLSWDFAADGGSSALAIL